MEALEGLSEKIFLDRYARKHPDARGVREGDTVLALVKEDAKFPVKEVGEVTGRNGEEVEVRLRNGDNVRTTIDKLMHPIERTPRELWERLAAAMASVETDPEKVREWQDRFNYILKDWKLVPGGRIAAGAGASDELTLFNCYVVPSPGDSRGGIMSTLGDMTEIMARGGGVGLNLSSLRPRRAIVAGVNGTSSGSVSWGGLFSYTTGLIEQGGCFGPEERISTDQGLVPASELADRMDCGERFRAVTHKGMRGIVHAFRNGAKPLFNVTTARGFRVQVTADHRMGVLRQGKVTTIPLRDLAPGDETLTLLQESLEKLSYVELGPVCYDRSPMSTRLNENVRFPEVLDERLAYVLGYFYGDGYVHWGRKVAWEAPKAIKMATANDYPEIRTRLAEAIKELFGLEPIIEEGDGAVQNVCAYSRLLIQWLTGNGLLKQKSDEVRVPEAVFRSPGPVVGAFIAGYFDADGCDRGRKGGYGFDSVSRGMIADIQRLLLANGIVSHVKETDRSALGWKTIYRLSVTGAEFKERFSRFAQLSLKDKKILGHRNHGNGDPREVWSALGAPGRYYQGVWDSTKSRISYRALSRTKGRLESDGNVALAIGVEQMLRTVPDIIVSIEPAGIDQTYDFEVEDVHMLCGNGFYTSNSRRGALMLMLNDWHPDLLDFITVKGTMGEITNANLSVCLSDGFMEAVKGDLEWELVFPDTKEPGYDELWTGDLDAWRRQGKRVLTYRTVRAREIWHAIIQSAWKSAEPGVVFMERYNKMSNSWYFNPIVSTNPCFHPDTRIATEYGLMRVAELYKKAADVNFRLVTDNRLVEEARVVNGRSYEVKGMTVRSGHVMYTGIKGTLKVELANGMELKVTPEHRVYTDKGWKEAQYLGAEDWVYVQSGEGLFAQRDELGAEWGMFLGWLIGDGWISNRGDIGMVFGKDDVEIIPRIVAAGQTFSGAEAKLFQRDNGTLQLYWWRKAFREKLLSLGVKAVPALEKEVPEAIFTAKKETVTAFLQALFSSDGTVYDKDEMHRTVRLTSTSKKLLQGVQLLLLNYGIHGLILRNELILSGNNIVAFKEQIGFVFIARKQEALERIARRSRKGEKFKSKVVSVSEAGVTEVFDIHEPVTHSLVANGLIVHNCGEQGLPGWGVCNLSAVNLSQFYDEGSGDVDWEELGKVTRWSVRFLDNVIDKTPYHFAENEKNQKLERRIGLGTMGLAELMIKLGIRYGSGESLTFLDKLYGFMAKEAYLASADIAAEKGAFPAFQAEPYLQSGFMKELVAAFPGVGEAIRERGMRNVTVITQAPTGSTGTMVGTSTGIEPYFAFEYYRQSRLGFDKQLVPIAQQWKDDHPSEELPDYYVSAMDLSAENHIRVQAAIQRWVDSSISKTANCPADFTVEDTKRLYELAYELGCKGVTIYRDGSRDVQVLSAASDGVKAEGDAADPKVDSNVDSSKSEPDVATTGIQPTLNETVAVGNGQQPAPNESAVAETRHQPIESDYLAAAPVAISASTSSADKQYKRRPQVLRGATYKINTPFGMAYITINDLNGSPGEIFLNVGKAGSDVFAMAEALGRVCSLFLRYGDHGNKVQLLTKHLKGIGGSGAIGFGVHRVESIADAVAKALELHTASGEEEAAAHHDLAAIVAVELASNASLDDGTKPSSRDLCPSCGSATLISIEGCKQCSTCGFSKCN